MKQTQSPIEAFTPAPRLRRQVGALTVALTLATLSVSATAQQISPCTATRTAMSVARDNAIRGINNLHSQNISVAANAKKCIDKVIKLASRITAPKFPNIASLGLEQIMGYLANQACKVVVRQAEGVVEAINGSIRPIGDQLRNWENQANGAIGNITMNGGDFSTPPYSFNDPRSKPEDFAPPDPTNPISPRNPVKPPVFCRHDGVPVDCETYKPIPEPPPPPKPVAAPQTTPQRIQCALGFGNNCR